MLEGWLEAYLLSGRHGILSSYEAFVHVIDSMFNQHAKWLKLAQDIPWRAPRFAQLPPHLTCMATGSQRVYSSGPRVPESRGKQEVGCSSNLPTAGCQLFVDDHGPVS
jgi:hypothetical protein